MIRRLAAALLIPAVSGFAALEVRKKSVSSSKQFIVYATNPNVRSAVAMKAEDLKKEFLDTLRLKDEWKMPIVLNVGGTPPTMKRPPRYQLGIYEGDDGQNKVQLDVFDFDSLKNPEREIERLLRDPEFQSQLLGAIVLENSYRHSAVKAGRAYERPPAWFVDGLTERIRSRDSDASAGLYSRLLSGAEPPQLGEFLATRTDRLDATSRAIFRAQAAAFLDALLSLPDGRTGLRGYLSVPRRSPTPVAEIVAVFPSLGKDARPLSRKWVLAMARASATDRVDLLSQRETAKQLDNLLAVKPLPDPKHPEVAAMSGPYAFPAIARSQNGAFILSQTENSLLQLSVRAHPLYKPLVDEYLGIIRQLSGKPKSRVDKRLAAAEEMRAGLTRETSEARDYLDWVEATKLKTENTELSSALDEVDDLQAAPPRGDAISRYLDAASDRGW
jgi:hypothetical protein